MKTVIITGASSGLGREFFRAAAKRFPDAEFWLIARREDKLRETIDKTGYTVTSVSAKPYEKKGLFGFRK